MALLQYFRSVPGEHLPLPGQSVVLAKGLFFRKTTVARKFNPRIITVIQLKRPPRKFSPAKNTRYTVCSNITVWIIEKFIKLGTLLGKQAASVFSGCKFCSETRLHNVLQGNLSNCENKLNFDGRLQTERSVT